MTEDKPWLNSNRYYNEWNYNLERAENIDLNKIPLPKKILKNYQIRKNSLYLKIKYFSHLSHLTTFLDHQIGLIRIRTYIYFPKLHSLIRKIRKK